MSKIKYHVALSVEERNQLMDLVSKGEASPKAIMHAYVLLSADENNGKPKKSEVEIAEQYHTTQQTVHTIRQLYSEKRKLLM
jgi:hypothetical protein